jgi:hypothetical protein
MRTTKMARISISRLARGMPLWALLLVAACSSDRGSLTGPGESGSPGPAPNSGLASITLAWDAPSASADGSPLTDLAGYVLYYDSMAPLTKARSTSVDVGAASQYTLTALVPGTYYVAVAARDEAGNESPLSASIRVEVSQ